MKDTSQMDIQQHETNTPNQDQEKETNQSTGSLATVGRAPAFEINKYATKKTIAQGLMDLALFMANASQLKAVLDVGPTQEYYELLISCITISMVIQVVVGVLLLILANMTVKTYEEHKRSNAVNNAIIAFIFCITLLNVVIAAFGIKLSNDNAADPNIDANP